MKKKQHPDQKIRERWNKWSANGEFALLEKYLEFMQW